MMIAMSSSILAIGIILLYGARQKWSWLIDPPVWLSWSGALLKRLFGSNANLYNTYIIAILLILAGVFGLVQSITILGRGLGYWT
jgi:hypothetical protein